MLNSSDKTFSQVAVVTGACGGIGTEICHQLLGQGFSVAATDISQENLRKLEMGSHNGRQIRGLVMDVCDLTSIDETITKIQEIFNDAVTVLINNAGVFERTPILSQENIEIMKRIIDVNLIGTLNCTSKFSPAMVKQRFGRIINIASIAGIIGAGYGVAYSAAKSGVMGVTKSLARELGPFGITVNAIAPGIIKTPMLAEDSHRDPQSEELVRQLTPIGRLGEPKDVAEVVAFLAACQTNLLTGEVIVMDGGMNTGTVATGGG